MDTPLWRSRQARLVLSLVLLVVGIGIYFLARGDSASASGDIFLEPAASIGNASFTPSVAEAQPAEKSTSATTQPTPSSDGLVRANGASPGLYGGVRDAPSCNAERLVNYLQANPDRAAPWAKASGVKTTDIRGYVATLTPALTRIDIRVTEFTLGAGQPVPRQSVLEAGTAVFLDRTAFPRIRCASGNPLTEPKPVSKAPTYVGPKWPTFKPTTIVVITPAAIVIVVLVDVVTGGVFARIPGSVTIIDIDQPAAGQNPAVVEPGGTANISGVNWPPGTAITMTFDNPAVTVGTATADGAGKFAADVAIPLNAAIGTHQVSINGGGFGTSQPVYVIPKGVPVVKILPA